jgi:hypothetical protein
VIKGGRGDHRLTSTEATAQSLFESVRQHEITDSIRKALTPIELTAPILSDFGCAERNTAQKIKERSRGDGSGPAGGPSTIYPAETVPSSLQQALRMIAKGEPPSPGDGSISQAAFLSRPNWVRATTPSSRPTSSMILPFCTRSTVIPVKCILRPVAAGRGPARKSLKAGPV